MANISVYRGGGMVENMFPLSLMPHYTLKLQGYTFSVGIKVKI